MTAFNSSQRRWWHWQPRSLHTKILVPLLGFMLLSLVGSTAAFVWGTARTRDAIAAAQGQRDAAQVGAALQTRVADAQTAATLLAGDPEVRTRLSQPSAADLPALDRRALVIRDRFRLDVVLLVTPAGSVPVNLVADAVLSRFAEQPERLAMQPNTPTLVAVQGEWLLVTAARTPDAALVLTGVALGAELARVRAAQGLQSELALTLDDQALTATTTQPLERRSYLLRRTPLTLAGRALMLTVARPAGELQAVTQAGLRVMLLSTLATFVGLAIAGTLLARSLSGPMQRLAAVAAAIAEGDLQRRALVETNDEISVLARTLNRATAQVGGLLSEQRLEAERQRAILASIADGVLVADVHGDITAINAAARRILGEHLGGVAEVNQSYHDLAAVGRIQQLIRTALDLPVDQTAPVQRFALGEQTCRLHCAPFWVEEQRQGVVAILQDVTSDTEAERIKSEFISVASHELRTPLTSMHGYLSLLRYSDQSRWSDDQRMFVTTIEKSTKQVVELVNDLLDVARLEERDTVHHQQLVAAGAVVDDVVQQTQALAQAADVALTFHSTPGLPPLMVDPSHLKRILQNVVNNGVKYTPAGGRVAVRVYQHHANLMIEVSDNGIGIPVADQGRIFERFFRARNSLGTVVGGTGLGLAITRGLVELNGGTITFRSSEGNGTTFSLSFPFAVSLDTTSIAPREELYVA